MILDADLSAENTALQNAKRERSTPAVDLPTGAPSRFRGKPVAVLCSNDYLGLTRHPKVVAAGQKALATYGTGSASSRLLSGSSPPIRHLETDLAKWLNYPETLVFPSGYQTNLGVLTTLADDRDLIVSDALNHASIIDACRLSRATVRIYDHGNPESAAQALRQNGRFRRRFVVTESIFSMDGDAAPLAALQVVSQNADACFIVDEAHALGVLGPRGQGLAAQLRLQPDILVGTLGKAFASGGGFVATSKATVSHLINRARSFIYTTALSPASAAAAGAALQVIRSSEGRRLREDLSAQRALLLPFAAAAPSIPQPEAGIVPFVVGSEGRALLLASQLLEDGYFVPAIRPPTVPPHLSRLRFTLNAGLSVSVFEELATNLANRFT